MSTSDLLRVLIDASKLPLAERAQTLSRYYEREYLGDSQWHSRALLTSASTRATYRKSDVDKELVMFGSNNYLGLAHDPRVRTAAMEAIREFGVSITGSPTLNGYSPKYAELEERLADFKGTESCMLFSSGFMANLGWTNVLLRAKDSVVLDQFSHTSVLEGLKSAKIRSVSQFVHNDRSSLEQMLERVDESAGGERFVYVEGLYSMHGDLADLASFRGVCRRHGAITVIDDAHGTGVLGENGRGIHEELGIKIDDDIVVGTLSKGIGCIGGFIAGRREIIRYLQALSPSYVFSAALPPSIVAAALESLRILQVDNGLVRRLRENVTRARHLLRDFGVDERSPSPIISLPLPSGLRAREATRIAEDAGIFLNGVGYPAVPIDREILRINVCAVHTDDDLQILVRAVDRVMSSEGSHEHAN